LTDQQIQYCLTSDGVRIALFVMGSGPPLVHTPPFPLGHLAAEWQNPANRNYNQGLAEGLTLVRYDGRGSGLSDRDVTDYSQSARLLDIDAVADHLSLERFALMGFGHAGAAAIEYAASRPDRVSHLILWHSYARTADVTSLPRIQAARSLILRDWNSYAELEGYRVSGFQGGAAARWYADYVQQSITPEGLVAAYDSIMALDMSAMLPRVQAPTLVMARRASEVLPMEVARDLTASIPDARLVTFEGTGVIPFPDIAKEFARTVREFVLSTAARTEAAPPSAKGPVLTPREAEILVLIARGLSSSEISRELSLSVRTVGRHITNIYGKIGARTRADATAYAIRNRLA
jgi:pimeloyl-ACP methyl ester carboxylesterase/DNA-binding CsgD family transcriptional regulator